MSSAPRSTTGSFRPRRSATAPMGRARCSCSSTALAERHAAARADLEEQLRSLAALDVLINNADRKRAHLLLGDDGRVRGIDNALSFLAYPRQRTVLIELGGQPLPPLVAAACASARR